jgi:hypothetical protein
MMKRANEIRTAMIFSPYRSASMMAVPLVAPWRVGDMSPGSILSDAGGLVSSELKGKVALVTGASRGLGEGAMAILTALLIGAQGCYTLSLQ